MMNLSGCKEAKVSTRQKLSLPRRIYREGIRCASGN